MIYIIDDDEIMAECIARYCGDQKTQIFSNAIEAMQQLDDDNLPKLIFLDILLDGPNGFTFLNELASYGDTAKIPIVIVSSLDLTGQDLQIYGVVGIINKDNMVPKEVKQYVDEYTV